MAHLAVCDVCGNPTEHLELKLFLSNRGGKNNHAAYTHHMDVGVCCIVKVKELGKWQARIKQSSNGTKRQQHVKLVAPPKPEDSARSVRAPQ